MKYYLLLLLATPFVIPERRDCGQFMQYCEKSDPLQILNTIKGYPDNYQQLLNAFYPINQAKPSRVIIAYFTNYTDPLPQECEQGTYPWKTYPALNYSRQHILWFLWSTTPIYNIANSVVLQDFGLYLPAASYFLPLNKSYNVILFQTIQMACVKVPWLPLPGHNVGEEPMTNLLGYVTTKVSFCTNTFTVHIAHMQSDLHAIIS